MEEDKKGEDLAYARKLKETSKESKAKMLTTMSLYSWEKLVKKVKEETRDVNVARVENAPGQEAT